MTAPWGHLVTERRFSLTADQDWAPEWATRALLDWAHAANLPLHVFQTNPSPALDEAARAGAITRGWHPNFAPGSSHGSDPRAVVAHLAGFLPGVRTVRSHGFSESYQAWLALADAGIRFDSQFPSAFSGHLLPMVHASGIVRLPVWFEDDVWMRLFPGAGEISPIRRTLACPGLKILNVHPVHIALNSPRMTFYDTRREAIYNGDGPLAAHPGFGVRDAVEAVVAAARNDGADWYSFEDLCDEVARLVAASEELQATAPVLAPPTAAG
ncbi:polysaccharide deacetylase WbmS family protein [Longimycelium tulufanense]|nr:hypothetical protein [Longimycelium tulufanense]